MKRPTRVASFVSAFAAFAACAPARPAAAPVVHTPAVRTRSVTFLVPPIGTPRLLQRESGGAAYYVAGGARVRFRDGDAVAAMQGFASAIAGAGRIGERWWFVSNEGTVASGADYLDNLRFERALGAPVVRAFVRDGGLAAVFADGRTVRADIAPVSAWAGPPASDAAPLPVPENEATAVADSALRQFPLSRLLLPSAALLGTGDAILRGGNTLYFASVESDGTLQATARVALGADVAGDCALHGWGARALITCPSTPLGDSHAVITPYVVDHDGADRAGPPSRGPFIVGREGHTLTYARPCPETASSSGAPSEAPPEASVTSLVACTLDRERDWRDWEYPTRARLIDVYDTAALVSETRDGAPALRYYDIDMARAVDVRIDDPAAEIDRAGFAADGRIVVLAHSGLRANRRSLVGVGSPGSSIDLHALGFYARDLDFADNRFGLAVGETAADIAETHDGGITWLRVDSVGVDADAREVHLFAAEGPRHASDPVARVGTDVRCTPTICRVNGRLVHTWDRSVEIVPPLP